jgi:hypothetical protein
MIAPVTTPVPATTVALLLLLDQVPAPDALLSDVTWPTHTDVTPVIAAGLASTVTVVDAGVRQPVL